MFSFILFIYFFMFLFCSGFFVSGTAPAGDPIASLNDDEIQNRAGSGKLSDAGGAPHRIEPAELRSNLW